MALSGGISGRGIPVFSEAPHVFSRKLAVLFLHARACIRAMAFCYNVLRSEMCRVFASILGVYSESKIRGNIHKKGGEVGTLPEKSDRFIT